MVTKPPTIDPRLGSSSRALVKALLVKKPAQRLCCRSINDGLSELKKTAFFRSFDWQSLESDNFPLKPGPYLPPLHDSTGKLISCL